MSRFGGWFLCGSRIVLVLPVTAFIPLVNIPFLVGINIVWPCGRTCFVVQISVGRLCSVQIGISYTGISVPVNIVV